jgi:hypothetical protein
MAVFPHPGCLLKYPTRQSRKISIPLINNPPGKNCLVRERSTISAGIVTGRLSSAFSVGNKLG